MSSAYEIGTFYDPLYGFVPSSSLHRRAFDLWPVQRLRRIKQLATVDLVYPGATHTRFAHTLGVFYLTSRILDVLEERPSRDNNIPSIARLAAEISAIFHDIGHGPFSHTMDMFGRRAGYGEELKDKYRTYEIILGKDPQMIEVNEFITRLRNRAIDREMKFWWLLDPLNIANISIGESPQKPSDHQNGCRYPWEDSKMKERIKNSKSLIESGCILEQAREFQFLSDIISVGFDADRMDYLRRDALFTGVETGYTDIWALVNGVMLIREPTDDGEETVRLRIDLKYSDALESLSRSRDLMYTSVYFHPIHRAYQELIIRAVYNMIRFQNRNLREILTMTDEELLIEMRGSGSLPQEVAERIMKRKVYNEIPFRISAKDIGWDPAKSKVTMLPLIYEKEKETTKVLLHLLNRIHPMQWDELLNPDRKPVIFDLETIPLVSSGIIEEPLLYDEVERRSRSLLDIRWHISEEVKRTREYRASLSPVRVYVPEELLRTIFNIIQGTCNIDVSSLYNRDRHEVIDTMQESLHSFSRFLESLAESLLNTVETLLAEEIPTKEKIKQKAVETAERGLAVRFYGFLQEYIL